MQTIVEDALGLHSGIQIRNVNTCIDRMRDQIIIYGEICARTDLSIAINFEPEICVNIVDQEEKILFNTESNRTGLFWASRKATFAVRIIQLSNNCDWDSISKIRLCLFWKKRTE